MVEGEIVFKSFKQVKCLLWTNFIFLEYINEMDSLLLWQNNKRIEVAKNNIKKSEIPVANFCSHFKSNY